MPDESEGFPPEPTAAEPSAEEVLATLKQAVEDATPDAMRGYVVYQGTFGGLTGRAVISADAGLTWR